MSCSLAENSELHFVSVGTMLLRTGKSTSSENASISHVTLSIPKLASVSLLVILSTFSVSDRELCLNISERFMKTKSLIFVKCSCNLDEELLEYRKEN